MRNYLCALLIVIILPVICIAAQRQWWDAPDSATLPDNSKIQIYDPATGSKTITGEHLKEQAVDAINTPRDTTLQKQPATSTNPYQRLYEAKDASGNIKWYVTAKGKMVIGLPKDLAVSSVYPANGATNVSNGTWFNYSSTSGGYNYWGRINTTTPAVTLNKSISASISTIYIQGSSIAPGSNYDPTVWTFGSFSGAAGTTYTMKVVKGYIVQEDGQTGSSCGSAMTEVAGVCQSTFTMR